jgi:hypothetical protein
MLGLELMEEDPQEAIKYLKMSYESGYKRAEKPLNELQAMAKKSK